MQKGLETSEGQKIFPESPLLKCAALCWLNTAAAADNKTTFKGTTD